MDDKRKNWRRGFFGDIFGDFDKEFENMRNYMDRMFERAIKEQNDAGPTSKPFVYGFSVRMGPDGIPHIQEFGNTRKGIGNLDFKEGIGREPLTDIIEDKDSICITSELPGVEKEDVELDLNDNKLEIKVNTEGRKYHKSIDLPDNIDPDTVKATYKNGVLDVSIKMLKPKEIKGKKITIE